MSFEAAGPDRRAEAQQGESLGLLSRQQDRDLLFGQQRQKQLRQLLDPGRRFRVLGVEVVQEPGDAGSVLDLRPPDLFPWLLDAPSFAARGNPCRLRSRSQPRCASDFDPTLVGTESAALQNS
jgi:hypothetical protein